MYHFRRLPIPLFSDYHCIHTVKPLLTNTSKEFIKCRILHFLIMECCRYLVFKLNDYMELFKTVPAYSWLFI